MRTTDPVTLDSATTELFRAFDVVMKRHDIPPKQMANLVLDVAEKYEEYVYENGDI